MTDAIYAAAYPLYRDPGWAPIKLAARTKYPPPKDFTGRNGVDPSGPDCHTWATQEPDGNIAIRLPDGVIGIDVDAYDNKTGAQTLAEAQNRWGRLPYSPRSTSRDDGISGIRLYRIPPGTILVDRIEFDELGIGDIEICQHHHRYVMCWPSIHPSGRQYQWLGIDSGPLEQPPTPGDIPDLPRGWLAALTKPEHTSADLTEDGPYNIREALTEGQPTRRVTAKLGEAILACQGASRYDHTRNNVLALLRYGKDGDGGVKSALITLKKFYVAATGPDRDGGHRAASDEFDRVTFSDSAAKQLAKPSFNDWTHNLSERPSGDQNHTGEQTGGDTGKTSDDLEGAITGRMRILRVTREANRRLDDEDHPPSIPPPVKNLNTLLTEPDTPTRYRIDDLAPADGRIILSAQYKAGKTTIVGNLIRALADGDAFLGTFTVNTCARRVVLVDTELSENTLRRWLRDQQITNTGAVADVVALRGRLSSFNLLDEHCYTTWVTRLRELGCDYLILDPLRPALDAAGLDESHDVGQFLIAYDALLSDAGINDTLVVHHMGHTGERARGDSRLEDWPDAIWRVAREDHDPASPRYFTAYGRDINIGEGRLGYDPETRRLTYTAGSRHDAKIDAAYIAVITLLAADAAAGGEGKSKSAIENETPGEHSRQAIRDALAKAVTQGRVDTWTGKRNARMHRIANPCGECGLPVTEVGRSHHQACPSGPELPDGLF